MAALLATFTGKVFVQIGEDGDMVEVGVITIPVEVTPVSAPAVTVDAFTSRPQAWTPEEREAFTARLRARLGRGGPISTA